MSDSSTRKQSLVKLWDAAIAAVAGRQAVRTALTSDPEFKPDLIIAVGKAAAGMCLGARDLLPDCEALVVTKYDHADDELTALSRLTLIESAHPLPDQNSLNAGQLLLDRVAEMSPQSRLLMLVSGGASALAEALPAPLTLADLQAMTDEMISGGKTIGEINTRRKQASLIKAGKLIGSFQGSEVRVYAISDVEGDNIDTIGSGIGDCRLARSSASSRIIASNQIAREQARHAAEQLGLSVKLDEETLYDDLFILSEKISQTLARAEPGIYIWGGEPTVMLPSNPGQGGRNQSLALALAEGIAGRKDISILVAGTDGTDGPTHAAGGLVDGESWGDAEAARNALQAANAGPYLFKQDSLFVTGPTNTNVMDLVIALID